MDTLNDHAGMEVPVADHAAWADEFDAMFAEVAPVFMTGPVRKRARVYLLGLLSQRQRKNGWTIAELAGEKSPDGIQRLLNRCTWDVDAARDALRGYVVQRVGDPGAVLVVGETGYEKKGDSSAGVHRQYSGTLGRVGNCQVGVHLAYTVPHSGFQALIDAELYLPEQWTSDRKRRWEASIPEEIPFRTKPQLTRKLLQQAVEAKTPFAWVTVNDVCGQDDELRSWLESTRVHVPYALVVPCSHLINTMAGKLRADEVAARVPAPAWSRILCREGHGEVRSFDWALVATASPGHHLMIRRSLGSGDTAYFLCWSPHPVTGPELAAVICTRSSVRDCVAQARHEAGLDQYQVRLYHAWYRHIILAMLAHAFLAVVTPSARGRSKGAASTADAERRIADVGCSTRMPVDR